MLFGDIENLLIVLSTEKLYTIIGNHAGISVRNSPTKISENLIFMISKLQLIKMQQPIIRDDQGKILATTSKNFGKCWC